MIEINLAERRGLAPHAAWKPHDLVSTESRHAGPVFAPKVAWASRPSAKEPSLVVNFYV